MEANIETDNGVAKSIDGSCREEWQAGYFYDVSLLVTVVADEMCR